MILQGWMIEATTSSRRTWRQRGVSVAEERGEGGGSLRLREEQHAIEAVLAGQGGAICSDLLARRERASAALAIVSPVSRAGSVWRGVFPVQDGPFARRAERAC